MGDRQNEHETRLRHLSKERTFFGREGAVAGMTASVWEACCLPGPELAALHELNAKSAEKAYRSSY